MLPEVYSWRSWPLPKVGGRLRLSCTAWAGDPVDRAHAPLVTEKSMARSVAR